MTRRTAEKSRELPTGGSGEVDIPPGVAVEYDTNVFPPLIQIMFGGELAFEDGERSRQPVAAASITGSVQPRQRRRVEGVTSCIAVEAWCQHRAIGGVEVEGPVFHAAEIHRHPIMAGAGGDRERAL